MSTRMEFDQKFMDRVLFSPGVVRLQEERARAVLARARATAPVDTKAYRNSLRIRTVRRRYRLAVIVEGTDEKTLLIEAKTGNLARSLKSIGRR